MYVFHLPAAMYGVVGAGVVVVKKANISLVFNI